MGKVVLILVIVFAGIISWQSFKAITDGSGYKPAPKLTPAQQIADIEQTVREVENNKTMPEDAKKMVIAQLRSKEPTNAASNKSAPSANK